MASTCFLTTRCWGSMLKNSGGLHGTSVMLKVRLAVAIRPYVQDGCSSPRGSGGCFNPNIIQLGLTKLCSAGTLGTLSPRGKCLTTSGCPFVAEQWS